MSTIDDRTIIENMLQNDGVFIDESGGRDRQVSAIYQYTNQQGGTCWKVLYHDNYSELMEFLTSPWVNGPVVRLWDRVQGVSSFGKAFLKFGRE